MFQKFHAALRPSTVSTDVRPTYVSYGNSGSISHLHGALHDMTLMPISGSLDNLESEKRETVVVEGTPPTFRCLESGTKGVCSRAGLATFGAWGGSPYLITFTSRRFACNTSFGSMSLAETQRQCRATRAVPGGSLLRVGGL